MTWQSGTAAFSYLCRPLSRWVPLAGGMDDVWPAAAALCRWQAAHAAAIDGASVLELGAGAGTVGLFAAGLGASRESAHWLASSGTVYDDELLPAETMRRVSRFSRA